ncbi:toxin-antitoxin system HicB family antitoxin [Acetobacterium wieringae]|uniref:toxin-antitoxin system HicB family antitoxin n=1 Tax=Acetobacterium wieringae TaxID=52694 RepID=UPI0026F0E095|nr:toxin-antitoxin system HicB family antitoxin [Acetobacterium wieringae]
MTTKKIRSGLRLPEELNEFLISKAKEKGISKNALILQILWKYLDDSKKDIMKK